MRGRRRLNFALFVLQGFLLLRPATAQERELHWKELAVDARLDADGTLHVRETHEMVFTGPWNGGERDFRVEPGHRFKFMNISRFDTIGGVEVPLRKGDLERIDEYRWESNTKLRWRSRLPTDPPFESAGLTYILEYELSRVLLLDGDVYRLDHDFAFPDRVGDIRRFTLRLDIDPAWKPGDGFRSVHAAGPIPPGTGFVLEVPLTRIAAGEPEGIRRAATPAERALLAVLIGLAALLLPRTLIGRDRALGRFEPLLPLSKIDGAWLRENVFAYLPEEVGAAWDERTSAPEVAAVLARLVAEKKMESRVEKKGWGPFSWNVLHLRLLVDRGRFEGYERELIDAFFITGDETSSELVREHYKKKGFNPAAKIEPGLKRRIREMADDRGLRGPLPPWWLVLILFLVTAAFVVSAFVFNREDVIVTAVGTAQIVGAACFALVGAYYWRDRVTDFASTALWWILPMAATFAGLYWLLWSGAFGTGFYVLSVLVLLWTVFWWAVLNAAKTRQTPARLVLRKRLASARAYFRTELRKPAPQLQDAWFPYLIAFGLGPQVDRWFRAFGGTTSSMSPVSTSGSSFGSSSGSSSWTGGGGAFGGAGATASWAVAAGSMASGVAAPSSSRSGGGGGGGSSSGGGGGGGW